MDFEFSYSLMSVEVLTATLGVLILVMGMIVPKTQRKAFGYLTGVGLLGIFLASFSLYGINETAFNGVYSIDDYSTFFKQLLLLAAIFVSFSALSYADRLEYKMEFFAFVIFATLGAIVMVSANDLITLYVGLETMTLCFFVLAAFRKDEVKSSEAAIKYLILGSVSSAVLLYGLTLIYGVAGTTIFTEIASVITGGSIEPALIMGILFVIAGFGFKISSVPFHMWSPDVYHGAPSPVTAFLASASKAAAFATFARVLLGAMPETQSIWVGVLAVLAAASMIFGNLAAIPQTNIKRLLAYSGVAQAGYIMTGMVAATDLGIKGVAFYAMIYVFATLGAFGVVIAISNAIGSSEIRDYAGLSQRSPMAAAVLTVSMLSMAGIPPLAGFVGKFYLFSAVIDQGFFWLALVGLIMSMISVYYYLSVAKIMYLGEADDPTPVKLPMSTQLTLLVTMILTVAFGVYPEPLSKLAVLASQVFLMP